MGLALSLAWLSVALAEVCPVLLLVAHADDEVLFAGDALMGRLRLGCRPRWHVVVATHSSESRAKEFRQVIRVANDLTKAKITGEMWPFVDCNYDSCERFLHDESIEEKLHEVLQREKWRFLITHNEQGEYLHRQHVGLHYVVKDVLNSLALATQLFVFNPIPELNVSVSRGKARLMQIYYSGTPTRARQLTFQGTGSYREHLLPVERFSRPRHLAITFSHLLVEQGRSFHYAFPVEQTLESLSMDLSSYLQRSYDHGCSAAPRYVDTCRLLGQEAKQLTPRTTQLLASMLTHLRCVVPDLRLKTFGAIEAWEAEFEDDIGLVELIALRPLHVGWKQAKQNSYKILGTSGPLVVSKGIVKAQQAQYIHVQPNDVLGWGIFKQPDSFRSNTTSCSLCSGSICAFDEAEPKALRSLTASVLPRQQPRRRQRFFRVMEALDISEFVNSNSTYEELLTLRQRLEDNALGIFEDKIRLRRELLKDAKVPATPSIHLSNDDFDIAHLLRGRRSYVVKPSHMSESQNVFVVRDGVDLLRMAWGHPPEVDVEHIQKAVHSFKTTTALKWECRALVASKPGVIVEELVLAQKQGKSWVDEYKFFTTWGLTILAENVPFNSGTIMEISRSGEILTTKAPCPPYCVAPCYDRMVDMAERLARHARTDFLRVDILVSGDCEGLYVSEVELFPASDFSQVLKDAVAKRWRRGYGF